jgi:hypothetical protein
MKALAVALWFGVIVAGLCGLRVAVPPLLVLALVGGWIAFAAGKEVRS